MSTPEYYAHHFVVGTRGAPEEETIRALAYEFKLRDDELAAARKAASECCDGYEGQYAVLQRVMEDAVARAEHAEAQLAALREALRPFAEIAEEKDGARARDDVPPCDDGELQSVLLPMKHFRRAAVLSQTGGDSNGK